MVRHMLPRPTSPASSLLSRNLASSPSAEAPKEKRMFKFQESLPRLPVPSLEETLPRYLETLKPLLSAEEFAQTQKLVKEFPEKGGKKLQELLLKRAQAAKGHWLEEWWNNLAYLEYRDPICIWVNYCFLLKDEVIQIPPGVNPQLNRAARMITSALKFKQLVESEELEPDMIKTTPTDMHQYPFLFNACRIPRPVRDEMVSHPGSRHIAVARSNRFYRVEVIDPQGRPYSPADIESQLEQLVELDNKDKEQTPFVGLFTAEHRDEWAKIYKELEADPTNRATLDMIEQSIMMLNLDDVAPEKLNEISELVLHSDAKNRWFEKQIQLVVFKNGKAGFNYEHARIDGMTTLRLTNFVQQDSQKVVLGQRSNSVPAPKKFSWNLNKSLQAHLANASKNVAALIQDNETDSLEFRAFGTEELKRLKLSPDSFVQLAYQLAFFRINSKLGATYESASTKEFYHGRTEVVRSATSAALDFCKAMERNSNVPLSKKVDLMQAALAAHNNYMKYAKVAKGVDRHLMGLRLIAGENNIPKPELFLDVGYSRSSHWLLSTSNCSSPNLRLFGFGPVVMNGYGLGYNIDTDKITVNITAKRSNPETSARLFANSLEHAFFELHTLANGVLSKL